MTKAPAKNKSKSTSAKKMQVGGLVATAPQPPNLTQAAKQAAAQPLSAEQRRVKKMQDATNASMARYVKRFGQPTDEASAKKAQEYQAGLPLAKQLQKMELQKAQQARQALGSQLPSKPIVATPRIGMAKGGMTKKKGK